MPTQPLLPPPSPMAAPRGWRGGGGEGIVKLGPGGGGGDAQGASVYVGGVPKDHPAILPKFLHSPYWVHVGCQDQFSSFCASIQTIRNDFECRPFIIHMEDNPEPLTFRGAGDWEEAAVRDPTTAYL